MIRIFQIHCLINCFVNHHHHTCKYTAWLTTPHWRRRLPPHSRVHLSCAAASRRRTPDATTLHPRDRPPPREAEKSPVGPIAKYSFELTGKSRLPLFFNSSLADFSFFFYFGDRAPDYCVGEIFPYIVCACDKGLKTNIHYNLFMIFKVYIKLFT
jgi:hypothetical protein